MCKTRWEHYLLSESNWKFYPFHLTQPQDHHFRQLLKKVESNDEHYKTSITLQLSLEIYQQLLCWDFASCDLLAETIKKFLLSWEYRTRPSSDNKTKFIPRPKTKPRLKKSPTARPIRTKCRYYQQPMTSHRSKCMFMSKSAGKLTRLIELRLG